MVANLAYAGPTHSGWTSDLARVVSNMIMSNPERNAAIIILPVTGVYSAGTGGGVGAATHAQRVATTMMEDSVFKMEATTCHVGHAFRGPLCKWCGPMW
jgi:hypothetical protein